MTLARHIAKKTAVVCHVEHPHERYAPGIAAVLAVADKGRHALVNLPGQVSVRARSEYWAGAGVRVKHCEVARGETEGPARIAQLSKVADVKRQSGFSHGCAFSCYGQRAKLERVMDSRKEELLVLKAE